LSAYQFSKKVKFRLYLKIKIFVKIKRNV